MQNTGAPLRDALELQRDIEQRLAQAAYVRSQTNMRSSEEKAGVGDYSGYWYWRQQAMTEQFDGDRHAYAEQVLAALLNPPSVATYRPNHPGHQHSDADGADGRDAHAS